MYQAQDLLSDPVFMEKIVLPIDFVTATDLAQEINTEIHPSFQIPGNMKGMDIGPASVQLFGKEIQDARTLVWNGPVGAFEFTPFSEGTKALTKHVAACTKEGQLVSVIGGGDTASAVRSFADVQASEDSNCGMTHISTGGGASLELLEGRVLPGLAGRAQ